MSALLTHRLALLAKAPHLPLLNQCLHGIERECLRVDAHGHLAMTPHPIALGSALTHPQITTDYSEALLEFITGTDQDPRNTLAELEAIHRFTYAKLGDEYLWSPSMPCPLPSEADIPIAEYGSSNIGRLKHVYRQGLALRYSKTMQCIAGIHYNFSLPEHWQPVLQADDGDTRTERDYRSARYIGLIRNFRRYSWLLMYLFGASPALDAGFLRGRPHQLEALDADTLYLPYATSLRMSDLGYQNNAQAGLTPCYDDLSSYTESLYRAVSRRMHPTRQWASRTPPATGSSSTPTCCRSRTSTTRTSAPSASPPPASARCRPCAPAASIHRSALPRYQPVPAAGHRPQRSALPRRLPAVLRAGRQPLPGRWRVRRGHRQLPQGGQGGPTPGLQLQRCGEPVPLREWAGQLLDEIAEVAALLDRSHGDSRHAEALAEQRAKVANSSLTPSARVLEQLRTNGESFSQFAMRQTLAHADYFRSQAPSADELQQFETAARQSLERQAAMEAADEPDFDSFVADYQRSLTL